MSNPIRLSRRSTPLMVHPIAHEVWTGHDAEVTLLTIGEVEECGAVQFFQLRKIKQRPDSAVGSRLNQLLEVWKMPLK